MKKIIAVLVVLGLCICAIAAIAIFLITRNGNLPTFTIIADAGTISTKNSANDQYVAMKGDQADYPSGTFIKTSEGSAAEVILPDNSVVSLDESTEIQINVQSNNVDITELAGKTWNRVETVTNGGSYTVKTPTTIAAVRGTIFGVDFNLDSDGGSQSTVYVQESSVNVSKVDSTGKGSEAQSITEGEQTDTINSVGHLTLTKDSISDYFKSTDWFKRNIFLDGIYKEVKARKGNIKEELKTKIKENHPKLLQFIKTKQNSTFGNLSDNLNTDYPTLPDFRTTSCDGFDSAQTDEYIASLDQYASLLGGQYSSLIDFMKAYGKDCADGNLDSNEMQQLQQLSQSFDQQNQ